MPLYFAYNLINIASRTNFSSVEQYQSHCSVHDRGSKHQHPRGCTSAPLKWMGAFKEHCHTAPIHFNGARANDFLEGLCCLFSPIIVGLLESFGDMSYCYISASYWWQVYISFLKETFPFSYWVSIRGSFLEKGH